MKHIPFITIALCACAIFGCSAVVGAANASIPKDAAQTCASNCHDVGMSLDSIVIMAANVGCVCSPRSSGTQPAAAGASGGMAAILMDEQQQQQQQQPAHK